MLEDLWGRYDNLNNHDGDTPLRIYRALRWADRGLEASEANDPDAACIFYWIAFNALYARRLDDNSEHLERQQFHGFLDRVRALDRERSISSALGKCWAKAKRDLIDNQYVSWGYWAGEPGWSDKDRLREDFERECSDASQAAVRGDHGAALRPLFERIYVLRNQLQHGAATPGGRVNRQQVDAGAEVMSRLIPKLIAVIIDNPDEDWGKVYFPVMPNP